MPQFEIDIARVRVLERHRKDFGDLSGLMSSIEEIGLLHPIVITERGNLIAGVRRLEVFRQLGRTSIPARLVDLDDVVRGEYAENAHRKDFTPSEMVAIRRELEGPEKEAAEKRMRAGEPLGKLPEGGRALDKVASFAGVGRRTLDKATAVVEAAEREPQRFGDLQERMDRTGKVDGVFRELRRRETWNGQACKPLPEGKFRCLVVDPPWGYMLRQDDPSHRAANPYPAMTVDEICGIDVGRWMEEDCLVWLWVTNLFLGQGFRVLSAWGLDYKNCLTWAKPSWGLGDWLRGQTEHCLIGRKGKAVLRAPSHSTLLSAPKSRHSEKPEEFYDLVEAVSLGPYADVFGREERDGWTVIGNELGHRIQPAEMAMRP